MHSLPYAEHEATERGHALYALHNLLMDDVELVADAIRSRRAILAIHLQKHASGIMHDTLKQQAERLDRIHTALSTLQHERADHSHYPR